MITIYITINTVLLYFVQINTAFVSMRQISKTFEKYQTPSMLS